MTNKNCQQIFCHREESYFVKDGLKNPLTLGIHYEKVQVSLKEWIDLAYAQPVLNIRPTLISFPQRLSLPSVCWLESLESCLKLCAVSVGANQVENQDSAVRPQSPLMWTWDLILEKAMKMLLDSTLLEPEKLQALPKGSPLLEIQKLQILFKRLGVSVC